MKSLMVVLLLGVILVSLLHFATPHLIGGDDVYRHIKYSYLLRTEWDGGRDFFLKPIPDTGFLFHLYLVPFTLFPDLRVGDKIAGIILVAAIAAVVGLILRKKNVPFWWFWLFLLLAGSSDFLFRLLLVRTFLFSIFFLLLGAYFLMVKNTRGLFVTALLYSLSYPASFLLVGLAAIFFLIDYFLFRKRDFTYFTAAVAGVLAGFLLNPSFPHNLTHIAQRIFPAVSVVPLSQLSVGTELSGYSVIEFFSANIFITVVWLFAIIIYTRSSFKQGRQFKRDELFLFVGSLFFFLLSLKSKRFVEYWVPFAVLFSGVSFAPFLEKISWKDFRSALKREIIIGVGIVLTAGAVLGAAYSVAGTVTRAVESTVSSELYRGASEWLLNHAQQNARVFNTQWDQYPQLYFWNSKNDYVIKIDPTSLYLEDQDLYWKWRKVSDDRVEEFAEGALYSIVKNDFRASYLFLENNRNPKLREFLEAREDFAKVYADTAVTLYKIRSN
jgi:hypothetical protein